MNLIDLHCDTAWKLFESKQGETLKENDFSVSLKEPEKGRVPCPVFRMFC